MSGIDDVIGDLPVASVGRIQAALATASGACSAVDLRSAIDDAIAEAEAMVEDLRELRDRVPQ